MGFSRDLTPSNPNKRQGSLAHLHIDLPLLLGILALCVFGLGILYSASGGDLGQINRQLIRFGLAFFVMVIVAQINPHTLQRWAPWIYGLGVLLLIGVLLFGDIGKGAQRWLNLGVFKFQPSEMVKLAVPLMIAWYLAKQPLPPKLKTIALTFILIAIPVGLIAKQPDLGTSLLVGSAGIFALFLAGISWRFIITLFGLAAAAAPVVWMNMHNYQKQRVLTFLDPEKDPLGSGYHIIQSKIAIGSGGLFGKGYLQGTQSNLEFLPEKHTDFIFTVFSEQFGFFGSVLLILLFFAIILKILNISLKSQNNFSRLVCFGVGFNIFVYLAVNLGMVTGLLPVVGVPLPIISYGGTAMLTTMFALGLVMSAKIHNDYQL